MPDYKHDHPGQKEPRAHGETHHENRIVDLNTAPEEELADLLYEQGRSKYGQ